MDESDHLQEKEDGVLIEKDGRFELVHVSDMQAQEDTSQNCNSDQNQATDEQQPEHEQETPNGKVPDSFSSKPSQSQVELGIKSASTMSFPANSSQKSHTLSTVNNSKYKLLVMRTKSAPGYREVRQSGEQDTLKRERNEAAFQAWLAKKNREIAEQRQAELSKIKQSEEDLKEKQRRNELAYQAWLDCKKQEYLQQKATGKSIRPVTSINRDDETKRREAFENWLSRKQEQKQKENDSKQKVREQEEVAAKKADPTIVAQAYKSWLHRKRAQAQDEAVKKEQYRKKYFRQCRELKQSTSLRFEGF